MKKSLLFVLLCINALLICLFFSACEKEDDVTVYTFRTVGTFSEHRVDYVRLEWKDVGVPDVEEEYRVDGIYIITLPSPAYTYIVYSNGKNWKNLESAYEEGLITRDDILAIAEAEKPFDM